MNPEKRTITNKSGKAITIMIDPENTIQHIPGLAEEWTITASQWRRLVRESDNTAWRTERSDNTPWSTERGATIAWTYYPYVAGCKHPGRK